MSVIAPLKTKECCRHVYNGQSKESTVAGFANTLIATVVESDCGLLGTSGHNGDALTHCVVSIHMRRTQRDMLIAVLILTLWMQLSPWVSQSSVLILMIKILRANLLVHVLWM
ncbi:hypothetical protein Plhal710r2_c040g0139131 [Plasmopara halstedii]